jgi:hypothetical protein
MYPSNEISLYFSWQFVLFNSMLKWLNSLAQPVYKTDFHLMHKRQVLLSYPYLFFHKYLLTIYLVAFTKFEFSVENDRLSEIVGSSGSKYEG